LLNFIRVVVWVLARVVEVHFVRDAGNAGNANSVVSDSA
jgi:hypothetical protein